MKRIYDAVVIGAGSVGLPAAVKFGEMGLKTLVLDRMPSPAQGQNKTAIGGIRATHSHFSKIKTCQRSIEIFKNWREAHGDDIGWLQGGYTFVAYSEEMARNLKEMVLLQKDFGLNINWLEPGELLELAPGIGREGLHGGTFSPDDGSASPLLSSTAFFRRARELGVEFRFRENVTGLLLAKGGLRGVKTDGGSYPCEWAVNAAGAHAREISALAGMDLPVIPESHEGGITEPCKRLFGPMVVDMRTEGASENYYFYQNSEGQIEFCITPAPPIVGTDRKETSAFLPLVARRMVRLMPVLAGLRVRRTWRGLYPMTPDGFPFVGSCREPHGLVHAAGMCGQGFMLGPGIGELVGRLVSGELTGEDGRVLEGYSLERVCCGMEAFR
jgi:sarcosine oxidase subunit beta